MGRHEPWQQRKWRKKKAVKTLHGNKYLQTILVECAWGATRKKDCYLKRKYQSLVGRRGKKKALVAIGHKIIIASYHIIKDKQVYKEPVLNTSANKRNKQIRNYMNRLQNLGVDLSTANLVSQKNQEDRIFTEQAQVGLSRK